ncbi:hypothetical protein IQ16_02855 [Bradyrhizobium huanghuaihaiense]|uniref:Uncharacterized protein n=1 Tax=Bradyrhizobium huanghuaihaiense TaxID=990078 RepID=A0A562RV04_9BRAD|nr:hypothetical protein IQ16_02855 [Bradyrhizobium huanghuaihaiense]
MSSPMIRCRVARRSMLGSIPASSPPWRQPDGKRLVITEGVMDILKENTAFRINVYFSKWALGEEIRRK